MNPVTVFSHHCFISFLSFHFISFISFPFRVSFHFISSSVAWRRSSAGEGRSCPPSSWSPAGEDWGPRGQHWQRQWLRRWERSLQLRLQQRPVDCLIVVRWYWYLCCYDCGYYWH
jgi:hypothetical protein